MKLTKTHWIIGSALVLLGALAYVKRESIKGWFKAEGDSNTEERAELDVTRESDRAMLDQMGDRTSFAKQYAGYQCQTVRGSNRVVCLRNNFTNGLTLWDKAWATFNQKYANK